MVSSFLISVVVLILNRNGAGISTHTALLIAVAFTTVCWVTTAFVGPQTDRQTLIDFYRRVRPFGPGWRRIRLVSGLSDAELSQQRENIPLALLGWVAGCTVVWSSLFAVGNFLYHRYAMAFLLTAVFVLAGLALLFVISKLWGAPAEKR